jgi:monovalent cation/proton antiporter MnhG/PhaG subunit
MNPESVRLLAAAVVIAVGLVLALAGTLGALRFPRPLLRLHGLALFEVAALPVLCLGLALAAFDVAVAARLLVFLLLAAIAGPAVRVLLAQAAMDAEAREQSR